MQLVVVVTRSDMEPVIPVGSLVFHGAATRSMMMTIGFLSHRLGPAFHLVLHHFWLLTDTFILSLLINLVVILLDLISMILLWGCLLYRWRASKILLIYQGWHREVRFSNGSFSCSNLGHVILNFSNIIIIKAHIH